MPEKIIRIGHGAGGKLTHQLIEEIFVKHFSNPYLDQLNDSSVFELNGKTAYTTDSYVIDPIFFPGGDIGKLAVSGTVNDLLSCGAVPKYLSAGFILEEGFEIESLEKIAISMAEEASRSGVQIVCGDTKVVKKGQCDKIYINTSGIGAVDQNCEHLSQEPEYLIGDKIIVTGNLGDHAIAVLSARNNISFEKSVLSDVAPLCELMFPIFTSNGNDLRFLRDITRGGLATVLNEAIENKEFSIELEEKEIPVSCEVEGICEVFGYDPLYLANEGKMVLIVNADKANEILETLHRNDLGKKASIIGEVTNRAPGKVLVQPTIGGSRIVDMLSGEMLPRIC